jgi:myo-inositol-1(or 4)-monophosphatase
VQWRRLLEGAAAEVQTEVSSIVAKGKASKALGVGASGDITLMGDKQAEQVLLARLTGVEGLQIVSEEAGYLGKAKSELVAVLDPLDGSSNFERGIQFYCTSAAIAKGGFLSDVAYGIVRNLVNGDVYWAENGRGSTKNRRRLATSQVSSLAEAVVGIDMSREPQDLTARMGPLIASVKRQVHYGANALEFCLLAEGRIDGFVDLRMKMRLTDFAAAYLIAREAGAVVTDADGGSIDPPLNLEARFMVVAAANETLHRKILRTITS